MRKRSSIRECAIACILAACSGNAHPGTDAPAGDGGDGEPPLAYPTRDAYRIKGLQPDFWGNFDEISGNGAGGVAMNLVWAQWEHEPTAPPCAATQVEHDGRCFVVPPEVDAAIGEWTRRGLVVTAVVYGVPAWARKPACASTGVFCAPADARDFGRFAGMLARRYDGRNAVGRIADFVIHNEVNVNSWYDVGCGRPCDFGAWLDTYTADYIAAYDAITAAQPHAKVLVSLEHHFSSSLDQPSAANPIMGGQTFLRGFAARVGDRAWRVAYHPYASSLFSPEFSPDDLPKVTFGNLGVLAGWLRAEFPGRPSAWEIQLTEVGVNSVSPSSEAAQAVALCRTFRNVLGTPGIESYIYHRMIDHSEEVASGVALGLRRPDRSAKPAWSTWALANRNDLTPPQLSCGFEDLPHVRVTRAYHTTRGHWTSSRLPPAGFTSEKSWRLPREPGAGTHLLYECRVGDHNLVSRDVSCEGLQVMGPIGYAFDAAAADRVPLYRCRTVALGDHFVSSDPGCEGAVLEELLGYALP